MWKKIIGFDLSRPVDFDLSMPIIFDLDGDLDLMAREVAKLMAAPVDLDLSLPTDATEPRQPHACLPKRWRRVCPPYLFPSH